jgi:hypothetical protein
VDIPLISFCDFYFSDQREVKNDTLFLFGVTIHERHYVENRCTETYFTVSQLSSIKFIL